MGNEEWRGENGEGRTENRGIERQFQSDPIHCCPAIRVLLTLVILTLGLLLAATADAQGGITITPSQLTVAGTRGAVETRTLLLRATDPITGLQILPLDLVRADGNAVLPASAVQAAPASDEIAAGGLLTVPVTFDLHGAPSGKFSGELLVSYHGGVLTVPVTVTIRDPWLLPLVVLVMGVGLGAGVSTYRGRGRPRDEVLVRVGQLRAQMRGDADLAEPFLARTEAHLVDVEAALQAEKWQDAQQAVEQAETAWVRWRKGRADWLAQLAYHVELAQRLEDLNPDAPYVQAVRRGLEDTLRDVPDLEGPDKLRERLDGLAQQINGYVRTRARLDELNALRNRLPADQAEQWQLKAQELQRRLDDLEPDDGTAHQTLQGEVEAAVIELDQLVAQCGEPEVAVKGVRDLGATVLHLLAPAPSARPLAVEEQTTGARARLRLFTWASYGIAVALLAGAGFGELYVANATFGANAWGDYFALLAWGFGAEAARASIVEMVRGWGLLGSQ